MIHDAHVFLNTTMTAQALPSALDPLSSSTLNKLHEAAPPSKKRKFEPDTAAGQLSMTSIVIRVRCALLQTQTPPTLANTAVFSRPTLLHYQTSRSSSTPSPHFPALDFHSHGLRMHHGLARTPKRVAYSLQIYRPWKMTCVLVQSRRCWRYGLLPMVGCM